MSLYSYLALSTYTYNAFSALNTVILVPVLLTNKKKEENKKDFGKHQSNQNFNMWFSSLLATLPLMNGAHSLQNYQISQYTC